MTDTKPTVDEVVRDLLEVLAPYECDKLAIERAISMLQSLAKDAEHRPAVPQICPYCQEPHGVQSAAIDLAKGRTK